MDLVRFSGQWSVRHYIFSSVFKPGDKVVVFKLDGTEIHGVVVLTEAYTSGNKVRVRSCDFILNVDEKQVAKDD